MTSAQTVPWTPTERADTHHKEKDMGASRMSIGISLPQSPPLGLNRVLVSLTRLFRLDAVWVNDHWQAEMPNALWDQQFSWVATAGSSPHASFDYKVLLGSSPKAQAGCASGSGSPIPFVIIRWRLPRRC